MTKRKDIVARAAFELLTGRYLGSGCFRKVFSLRLNSDKVIKISKDGDTEGNTMEYVIWNQWQYTKEGKKWLAKCFQINDSGMCLIQERLTPFVDINDKRLPKLVPQCFTDLKIQNWGVTEDGKVKCLDYASTLLLQEEPWKLVRAEWWDVNKNPD